MTADEVQKGDKIVTSAASGDLDFKRIKGGTAYLYLTNGKCVMVPKGQLVTAS